MKSNFRIILLIFISSIGLYGQEKPNYKIRYDSFVYGDITAIGNTIVNRATGFVSSANSYDDLGDSAKYNDQFKMEYINIDGNSSTFSSSSAYLHLPKGVTRVVYAGLYWAATYPYNRGYTNDMVVFKPEDSGRLAFDKVLLKLPGVSDYKAIFGEVLYDGAKDIDLAEMKPYVAYADITEWIQFLKKAEGEYTVANIRSAAGQIKGGVSAGWTMVIVYEKSGEKLKKITTYDGMLNIYKRSFEVDFKGFKTPSSGKVEARLINSAIEVDNGISGSRVSIEAPKGRELYLRTKSRDVSNFLNGTVTLADTLNLKRTPSSKNTLGYDLLVMPVPNTSNLILANDEQEFKVKYTSSPDQYYNFFTAFSVDSQMVTPSQGGQEAPADEEEEDVEYEFVELISKEINPGYYNIVGTFSQLASAERYRDKLDLKGYYSRILEDEVNQKYYIYVDLSEKAVDAIEKQKEFKKYEVFQSTWILLVKKP